MKNNNDTLIIKNGKVLLPNGKLAATQVLLENGKIAKVGACRGKAKVIDAAGGMVVPGFIDLHTHGLGMESTVGNIKKYAALAAKAGATTCFPTMFGPPENSAEHMRRHRAETDEFRQTPQIGGFRLESPYLAYTGAGISRDLVPITEATTRLLLEAGGGHVKIWDVSPDLAGAPDTIRMLTKSGIVCSIAHTRGTFDQMRAAVEAGSRLVTHLFDTFVVPEMTDPGVYPAGLVDYMLTEDRLTCEIIPDGTHVHPMLVEKTFRCKPKAGIVFVTDSNFGAGLPNGDYDLPQGWGRARINGSNNGVRIIDREMGLAGSAMTPIDCFRNAVRLFGRDLATASRLCSKNQARLLGLNKGEIAAGKDADLAILSEDFEVRCTIARGQIVYLL